LHQSQSVALPRTMAPHPFGGSGNRSLCLHILDPTPPQVSAHALTFAVDAERPAARSIYSSCPQALRAGRLLVFARFTNRGARRCRSFASAAELSEGIQVVHRMPWSIERAPLNPSISVSVTRGTKVSNSHRRGRVRRHLHDPSRRFASRTIDGPAGAQRRAACGVVTKSRILESKLVTPAPVVAPRA
jgi:hypothetical protein